MMQRRSCASGDELLLAILITLFRDENEREILVSNESSGVSEEEAE